MIIVPVKEGENIERALKKFKRKFEKTGIVKELRARQQFDKPSVLKRLAKDTLFTFSSSSARKTEFFCCTSNNRNKKRILCGT